MFTSDLGTFTAGADITVYVAMDSRVVPVLPEWLGDWEKADGTITATSDLTFELYRKNFNAGETVTLGMNGGNGNNTNYLVFVKNKEIIINGTLFTNLKVYDTENGSDWSIETGFGEGVQMFGDRTITCASLPAALTGAEFIRTACDSKLLLTDLGEFSAGAYATFYVAMDTRVIPLPEWLSSWKDTGLNITTSNDVTMKLYQKTLNTGEPVTLGTNGGLNESANYIVLAKAGKAVLKGDVNLDGNVSIKDAVLIQKYLHNLETLSAEQKEQANLIEDNTVNIFDLCVLKNMLIG